MSDEHNLNFRIDPGWEEPESETYVIRLDEQDGNNLPNYNHRLSFKEGFPR